MNRDSDYAALAAGHYENFPVGSILVPRRLRRHVHRIYAFARTADDLADELRDAEALARFRADFDAHLGGRRTLPLLTDLAGTIAELELPADLFRDLLDAFTQDLHVRRYADDRELFDYCRRSADPVGRLVLRVFGHRDPVLDVLSDRICTGLQLVNHLQDLRADLVERDRIYFPSTDLARFGVAEDDLRRTRATPAVRALVREWLDRTAALLRAGWPLTRAIGGRLRVEVRAIVRSAAAVIAAIRRADHDVLAATIRLSRGARAGELLRAVATARVPEALT